MKHPDAPYYNDLNEAVSFAFALLSSGVKDRRAPFHTPIAATVASDGAPALRTVVLRHFNKDERILGFHTDLRSRKFAEMTRDPRVSLLFYDPGRKLQLRCLCLAQLHRDDETALAAWHASRQMSRVCYAQTPNPGASLTGPGEAQLAGQLPNHEAFSNFVAIRARIETLDWLYLASAGHRRALFDWREGSLRATWLAP